MPPPAASRNPPPSGGGERGFTLLELIVVLVLAGMLLSLAVPSLFGALESGRLRSCAAEVRAAFNLARTLAASGGRERAVTFHLERGAYAVDGEAKERLVPEGVAIAAARRGTEIAEQGEVRIRFYPDGSAEEAEILLSSRGGGRLRVTVDPLTGLAEAGT
jgi:general secretion pathway protein H